MELSRDSNLNPRSQESPSSLCTSSVYLITLARGGEESNDEERSHDDVFTLFDAHGDCGRRGPTPPRATIALFTGGVAADGYERVRAGLIERVRSLRREGVSGKNNGHAFQGGPLTREHTLASTLSPPPVRLCDDDGETRPFRARERFIKRGGSLRQRGVPTKKIPLREGEGGGGGGEHALALALE